MDPLVPTAKNACIGHANLVTAIKESHKVRPCIFEEDIAGTITKLSSAMRLHLAKYRDVLKDDRLLSRIVSRVPHGQII